MAIHTGVDPRVVQHIAADVRQLTEPILLAVRRRIVQHPPLLDQLRAAIEPGAAGRAGRPERRSVPDSRPPISEDASDALAAVYVELAGWHARHALPSPPRDTDWQKAALRQLVGMAPTLAPAVADWLGEDVATWWRLAAVHSGWRPAELLKLR